MIPRTLILFFFMIASDIMGEMYPLYIPTRIDNLEKKYLAADLYSMDTTVAKPVIFIQTPYNKNLMRIYFTKYAPKDVQLPIDTNWYNYVIMDWRGFYGSKNADSSKYERGNDGYDAVEWIASQKWCNGKIGTWGASALGLIQFQTARQKPPHLTCAVPIVKDYKIKYTDYYYGGDFRKEHVEALVQLGFIPSTNLITSMPVYNNIWKQFVEAPNDYPEDIEIPMLLIGGWYDHFPSDVIRAFHDLRDRSGINARNKHKLIMGPWLHSDFGKLEQGILSYPNAVDVPKEAAKRFFDYYLLNAYNNGWQNEPVINYYILGENKWLTTDDRFKEIKDTIIYFLHPDKILRMEPVPITIKEIPPDTIIYNPLDPSPTVGGERFPGFAPTIPLGPQDMRKEVESRSDVLIFSTEILVKPVSLFGKLKVKLFVRSDRTDTDFAIRLCDVFPDGKSIIIRQGIKRMRFRNSLEKEEPMETDKIYPVEIEIDDLAMSFEPGHKLRIIISSSDYPHYDINLNNGGELYKPGDTLTATNFVYHDYGNQSAVFIPTMITTNVKDYTNFKNEVLNLYPNPAHDYINIQNNQSESGLIEYEILNLMSMIVHTGAIDNIAHSDNHTAIDISKLIPGFYSIRFHSNKNKIGYFIKY